MKIGDWICPYCYSTDIHDMNYPSMTCNDCGKVFREAFIIQTYTDLLKARFLNWYWRALRKGKL